LHRPTIVDVGTDSAAKDLEKVGRQDRSTKTTFS
jgi:hypothetical protein